MPQLRWLNPLYAEHHVVSTDLPPSACAERLRDRVVSRYSSRTWIVADQEWPVFGRVSDRGFDFKKVHTWVRPWLLQEARGKVEAAGAGSVVHVRIGLTPINAVLILLEAALLIAVAIVAPLAFPDANGSVPRIAWALVPLIAAVPYVLDRLWWARDAKFLMDWLAETVAGRVDA